METKKTRFAALTAGVAIAALVVTACSGSTATNSPSASNPSASTNSPSASTSSPGISNRPGLSINGAGQTLTVLMGVDGKYGAQQQQWFKDVSTAFEAQTGAKVTFGTFASGNEELTKIQTSVVANQGPDVYVCLLYTSD